MIWYDMIWYDMIWYDMIWYDMIWYDMIWYDMIWYMIYDMICDMISLTAIGLPSCGSSTVHIYTQTIRRTTQSTQTIHRTTESTQTINTVEEYTSLIRNRTFHRNIIALAWPSLRVAFVFHFSHIYSHPRSTIILWGVTVNDFVFP